MRQGVGCLSPCHRCSGGNRPLWAGSLFGLWSTNLYKFPRMERSAQQPATRPDVEWCVAEGRRGRVWAAEARDRIDPAVGRAVARAARSVRSAGAIRRDSTTKSKAMSSLPTSSKRATGRIEERGSKEGRGCCRRRDKHAREMSLREGQRPPENGTLAIRGGWCPLSPVPSGVRCVARN